MVTPQPNERKTIRLGDEGIDGVGVGETHRAAEGVGVEVFNQPPQKVVAAVGEPVPQLEVILERRVVIKRPGRGDRQRRGNRLTVHLPLADRP